MYIARGYIQKLTIDSCKYSKEKYYYEKGQKGS